MPKKSDKSNSNNKKSKSRRSTNVKGPRYSFNSDLLVDSWQARDLLYQNIFGQQSTISPSSYAPPAKLKTKDNATAKAAEFEIEAAEEFNEQELGIFTYAPDPLRPYWTYITAGLSTPWLQNEALEVSGFGLELMIKSPTAAEWPAQLLRTMAYYIFNHMGTLSPGKRLALNSSIIAGSNSALRNVLIWYADDSTDCWYQLPSGGFGIFNAIGVTDDEMRLTETIHEEYGTWCMLQILKRLGLDQITDPHRSSVLERENISSIIDSVKDYAEQFHQAFPTANQIRGQALHEQN